MTRSIISTESPHQTSILETEETWSKSILALRKLNVLVCCNPFPSARQDKIKFAFLTVLVKKLKSQFNCGKYFLINPIIT